MHELHELHEHVNFTQIVSNNLQIISNRVMYGSAKTCLHVHLMTSQSLATDACKEEMPRGAALQVSVWDVWGCQSVWAKKHVFTEQMHSEVGVHVQMEGWNEDGTHPNISKWCLNVNSSNFVFYSSSFELCVHLHGTKLYLTSFSSVQRSPNSRPLLTFLPFLPFTVPSRDGRDGGGRQPPSSWREAQLRSLQSMNSLLCSRGSWGRAEVFGVRGDLPGRFTRAFFGLAKAWSVDFRFVSRYCWMIFGRTNAHLFKRMNVGHGWTPMCKIVTMKLGQINDMPMKRCISMHLGDPHPRSCSQSFPGWNWQPTKTTEFILIC